MLAMFKNMVSKMYVVNLCNLGKLEELQLVITCRFINLICT